MTAQKATRRRTTRTAPPDAAPTNAPAARAGRTEPHAHPAPTVRVALLGAGNVGGALAEILLTRADDVAARTGIRLELAGIAVANPDRARSAVIPADLIGTDAAALVARDDVDVVVEVIGGLHPAHELVEAALRNGKPVVTANKALLATAGAELAEVAANAGVDLLYEAAVAGAIPVIRPLRESLAGEQIVRIMGIVNGTTNYILTKMEEAGDDYDDVLREAQALGLAERDPTADVEGHDAAAKAAILASLAFGSDVVDGDVHREGISGISAADVAYANRLGYSVKLLAVAELLDGGPEVSVRVHPAMVPKTHPLASVRGAFNAVFVEGAVSGELMLYGRGAGGGPTASAVLGDVVDASRNLLAGAPAPAPKRSRTTVRSQNDMRSAFYLSMDVADRPGVLAAVAKIFGDHDVSIRAMEQVGLAEEARLIFLTHVAREGDLLATIDALRNLQAVDRVSGVLRVVDGADGHGDDGS
ncbi:MAG TPA: homoserine dehydrogenase, partial [Acidimicrobiales bacterium]|nr:homoserine dehydrogenase [Acidimicrobiales bacterium]